MLESINDASAIISESTNRLLGLLPTPSNSAEQILRLDEDFSYDKLPVKRAIAVGRLVIFPKKSRYNIFLILARS